MSAQFQPSHAQAMPAEIDVTLLLTGGHQYTVPLPPDAPLLQQLFEAMMAQQTHQPGRLFQIPVQQGQAVLCFTSDRLVGLVTEPPIILQNPDQAPISSRDRLESQYVQIENFLPPELQQQLLTFTLRQELAFVPTTTSTGELDYRKSVVLHFFPEFADLLQARIEKILPTVLQQLNLPSFQVTQVEAQLTAHNDGHYYKVHNDNGSPETATRELTYVYYFYREPKGFSDGELCIYDSKIENNYYVQADTFKTVTPLNNSIVFFPSHYMHEVLPIRCPSRAFADSRFTINGWIRR